MSQTMETDKSHPRLDERFIKNIKGKDFVLYSGLLDLAHQKGLKSIHVEPIQYPTKDNGMEGICKAVVESPDGREFTEIGDASPKNVNSIIKEHVLRMAATRAKARALRDYTNIGITCLEELGDIDPVAEAAVSKAKSNNRKSAAKKESMSDEKNTKKDSDKKEAEKAPDSKKKEEAGPNESKASTNAGKEPKMSNAQKNAIMNLAKRRGIAQDELLGMVEEAFNRSLDYLSTNEASAFIRQLQQAA